VRPLDHPGDHDDRANDITISIRKWAAIEEKRLSAMVRNRGSDGEVAAPSNHDRAD
jgi:hypothetical protein